MKNIVTLCISLLLFPLLIACDNNLLSGTDPDTPEVKEPIRGEGIDLSELGTTEIFEYAAQANSLFLPTEIPAVVSENLVHESVIGFTYLEFNDTAWNLDGLQMNDQISLDLPDDIRIEATVLRQQETLPSVTAVTAQLNDPHEGTVTLTQVGQKTISDIKLESENRHFQVRYDPNDGSHYLMEIDPAQSATLPGAQPLRVE